MIDINTLEAVALQVNEHSHKIITPIPGSTLSAITQPLIERCKFMLSSVDDKVVRDEFSIDDTIKLVNAASHDDPEYCNSHQDLIVNSSKDIARIMSNNIYLARSVVLPMIDKYTEQLTTLVSEKCNRSNLALNIVEDKKRVILASPQLKGIVRDQAQRTNYEDISLPRYHADDITIPELRALIVTGNRSFDDIIETWLDVSEGELILKTVYNDIFRNQKTKKVPVTTYLSIDNYQTNIVTLLICWGLVKNPQDGISVSGTSYKKDMEILSAVCCGMISQAITRFERSVKHKNLVLSYPVSGRQFCYDQPEKNCIVVDQDTYKEFIELGGRPEMLFGSYLTGDRTINSQGILANAPKYIKEYTRQTARGRLTAINNVLTIVKTELRNIALDIVKEIDANNGTDEVGEQEVTKVDYELRFSGSKHFEKANDFIRGVNSKSIEDYYSLIRSFVCVCFFEGSMVHKLLNKMDALDPDNTQDTNEMAIVATTDLVVDWLLSQIESDVTSVSLEGFYK